MARYDPERLQRAEQSSFAHSLLSCNCVRAHGMRLHGEDRAVFVEMRGENCSRYCSICAWRSKIISAPMRTQSAMQSSHTGSGPGASVPLMARHSVVP